MKDPILTVGNWSPTFPGLVGLLNLNGSLTKAGVRYSSLWSIDFEDNWFIEHLSEWLETGHIDHDTSQCSPPLQARAMRGLCPSRTRHSQRTLDKNRSVMGIFDEGCMGMYNAIIPDELLFPLGVFKERLSQSALYYATTQVSDEDSTRGL